MSENKKDVKFWVGFFIGGLIGAIVLFFLGTKEGKKTSKQLEEKGKDILDEFVEKLESLEKKGEEIKGEVAETASEKIDTALAHIEALQERGRETTAALRRRFKNIPKK